MVYTNTFRQKASKSETSGLNKRAPRIAEVTLTAAQVLASNTTPVVLVPAPGAGKFIEVLGIVASVDYNTTAYATNTTLEFRYTNGSGTKVTADAAALLNATADKAVSVKSVVTEVANTLNAPVVVRTATGNPTAGNSPVKVKVEYRVHSI